MACHEAFRRVICPSAPFLLPSRSLVTLHRRPQWLSCGKNARHVSSAQAAETRVLRPQGSSGGKNQETLERNKDTEVTIKRFRGSKARKRKLNASLGGKRVHNHESDKGGGRADGWMSDFQASLAGGRLDEVLQHYPWALRTYSFTKGDTRTLAGLLHNQWRGGAPATQKDAILRFAKDIVGDLRRRILPLDSRASVHLLSLFKEAKQYDEALRLWSWLATQSDEEVDMRVYGAAIELLTYCGESLRNLEILYSTALKRFPKNFNEYHLSPNAILTDRAQRTITSGASMTLLQGILTARLKHGDWQNAYLALDTALRLYPTQMPPRMLEIFVYERPLDEAFYVYLLSCRVGTALNPQVLSYLSGKLTKAQEHQKLKKRAEIAEGMLKALYAHAGVSGTLDVFHLSWLIRCVFRLFPRVSPMAPGNERMIFSAISLTQKAISTFEHLGIKPRISTYNHLISLASELHSPTLLKVAVQGFTLNQIRQDRITYRTLLAAAGSFGKSEQVEESWKVLVETAGAEGRQLELADWLTLAKAAKNAHCVDYAMRQLDELEPTLTPDMNTSFLGVLDHGVRREPSAEDISIEDYSSHFTAFEKTALSILESIKARSHLDFTQFPSQMSLFCPVLSAPEQELRSLYDELSTESQRPGVNSSPKKDQRPTSATGFPLDELRYENWKSINELLAEAEMNDIAKRAAVDEASRAGKPTEDSKGEAGNTSSPVHNQELSSEHVDAEEAWVDKILRLRGLDRMQLHQRQRIEAFKERLSHAGSGAGRRALDSDEVKPSKSGFGRSEPFTRANPPRPLEHQVPADAM